MMASVRYVFYLFALLLSVHSSWNALSQPQALHSKQETLSPRFACFHNHSVLQGQGTSVKPYLPVAGKPIEAGITEFEEDVEEFGSSHSLSGSSGYHAALFYALAFVIITDGHNKHLESNHFAFLPSCRRHLLFQTFRI